MNMNVLWKNACESEYVIVMNELSGTCTARPGSPTRIISMLAACCLFAPAAWQASVPRRAAASLRTTFTTMNAGVVNEVVDILGQKVPVERFVEADVGMEFPKMELTERNSLPIRWA